MSDNTMQEITLRIKRRRLELGYSFQDLANLTGLSKSTLQRYETGSIKSIPLNRLKDLANALKVTPEWIMGWEEDTLEKNEIVQNNSLAYLFEKFPNESNLYIPTVCKHLRIDTDLTEKKVAQQANLSLQDYLDFESGRKKLELPEIKNIIKALNSNEYFVSGMLEGFIISESERAGRELSSLNTIIDGFQNSDAVQEIQKKLISIPPAEREIYLKTILKILTEE